MASNRVRKNMCIFCLAGICSQLWSHLISIRHRSSSSLLLQYSSFCICFLIFSSWIFLARMLGFTSTCRSGFTFFCKASIIKHGVNEQLLGTGSLKMRCHFQNFDRCTHLQTLYCRRCRRPFRCISFAFGSLKLHSHNLQWKRMTFPSSFRT